MPNIQETSIDPITQERVLLFADAVGDYNPVHLDEAFAKKAGMPKTVVHGPLTVALILDVIVAQLGTDEILNLDVRLRAPVHPGDALTICGEDYGVSVKNADEVTVATAVLVTKVARPVSNEESILVEMRNGGVRVLTLNRPDRLNAWNSEMRDRLRNEIEDVASQETIRALIITGAGRAFSAGEDVGGMEDLSNAGTRRFRSVARTIHATFDLIESLEIPVIAAINGVAAGGGCELALSCDFRVMAEGSRLLLPEGKVGLIPGSGGCSRLVKYVGLGKAKEMVMLGRSVDPDQAVQIGLATESVEAGAALEGALELAEQMSRQAPLALGMAKLVLNTCVDVDHESGRRLERIGQSVLKTTEDHREAASAFLSKRDPEFVAR